MFINTHCKYLSLIIRQLECSFDCLENNKTESLFNPNYI